MNAFCDVSKVHAQTHKYNAIKMKRTEQNRSHKGTAAASTTSHLGAQTEVEKPGARKAQHKPASKDGES